MGAPSLVGRRFSQRLLGAFPMRVQAVPSKRLSLYFTSSSQGFNRQHLGGGSRFFPLSPVSVLGARSYCQHDGPVLKEGVLGRKEWDSVGKLGDQNEPLIVATEVKHEYVNVFWDDGLLSRFHYPWLRDNCQCTECVHPTSQQKFASIKSKINVDLVPENLNVSLNDDNSLRLEVKWDSEEHTSTFPMRWLYKHCYSPQSLLQRKLPEKPVLWTRNIISKDFPECDYGSFMDDDRQLLKSLVQLSNYGIAFIRNTPRPKEGEAREVVKIAERIGPIRNTFYGHSWDVLSKPNAENIAYTSLELLLHQDLLYFEAPPGLQFLHCVDFQIKDGGETEFVDGFKVAHQLRIESPSSFNILTEHPMTFQYINKEEYRRFRHNLITMDREGHISKIYYAPQFEGPLDIDGSVLKDFYKAYQLFAEISMRPEYRISFQFKAGDTVIFNNRRLLHGRNSFDPSQGLRHLQGTYVDFDDFRSRWNVLRRKYKVTENSE